MKKTNDLYFDMFWSAYPKRVKKILALKEWKKLRDFTISDILAGIEAWKQTEQWQNVQFVPDPERFLKYRRWEDEVPRNAGSKHEQRVVRTLEAAKRLMGPGGSMGEPTRNALSSGNIRAGDSDLLRVPKK